MLSLLTCIPVKCKKSLHSEEPSTLNLGENKVRNGNDICAGATNGKSMPETATNRFKINFYVHALQNKFIKAMCRLYANSFIYKINCFLFIGLAKS